MQGDHPHPPYVKIFWVLLGLTLLSIVFSQVLPKTFAPYLIFTLSTIKATLIALYYMHLKYEGKWILSLAIIPLIIFVVILVAVMPDALVVIKK